MNSQNLGRIISVLQRMKSGIPWDRDLDLDIYELAIGDLPDEAAQLLLAALCRKFEWRPSGGELRKVWEQSTQRLRVRPQADQSRMLSAPVTPEFIAGLRDLEKPFFAALERVRGKKMGSGIGG